MKQTLGMSSVFPQMLVPDRAHSLRSSSAQWAYDSRVLGTMRIPLTTTRLCICWLTFVLVLPVTLASAQPSCTAPQKPMLDVELFLGRGKASDVRWRDFLVREVTPRFPDGLTVYETTGQWRDPARNVIVREKSRVLRIIV